MSVEPASGARPAKILGGRTFAWSAAIAVLAITLLVFWPICHFQFASIDDGPNIYLNPHIQYPESQDVGFFWTHTYYDLYTPVTYCAWALGTHIALLSPPRLLPLAHVTSSLNPAVFHTFNFIFHACNALLVFAILRRFGFRAWPCAAGAALFAVHPCQVESVAWITGFNNVFSGFFCLSALYLYLLSVPVNDVRLLSGNLRNDSAKDVRWVLGTETHVLLVLSTLCYICGLLSKPTATVLPIFVVILEAVAFRRPIRRWVRFVAFWGILAAGCLAATLFATHGNIPEFWYPLWSRPFVAGDALSFYLVKLVLPIRLTFDYGRSPKAVLSAWWGYVDWVIPIAVAFLLWRTSRRSASVSPKSQILARCLRVAFLLFVGGLVSVLGLVPFYSQPISTVSDRYLYFALLGPALALTALCSEVPEKFARATAIGVTAVLVAFTSRTVIQEFVWTNPYSLTSSLLEESPESALGQHLAGGILSDQHNYSAALPHFLLSKKLDYTEVPSTDQDIAFCLVHLGRYAEAVEPLERAIALEPYRVEHWTMIWFVISRVKDLGGIEAFMQHQAAIKSRDGLAQFTLGVIQMQRGNAATALPALEAGARATPQFPEPHTDLGAVYEQLNRFSDAEAQYELALRIDPRNADARAALAALRGRVR